jgi:zinc transport system ATP-binding protein
MSGLAASPESLLVVERLGIVRGREVILEDVSLAAARGHLHAIVGPNGAGKSTLLAAILAQLPFTGRILLNWADRGGIGYVPQAFVVDPTLPVTVEDFLGLTRQRRPVCLGLTAITRRRVHDLLSRIGLPAVARRPLSGLSGGELRRVLLGHALDPEPELLLLDEPGTGLDEASARWLEDTLGAVRQQGRTTVLMVSHDFEQVRRLADRVTVLDRQVVADGPAATALSPAVIERLTGGRRSVVA